MNSGEIDRLYIPIDIVRKEIAKELKSLMDDLKTWEANKVLNLTLVTDTVFKDDNSQKVGKLKMIKNDFDDMIDSLKNKVHISDQVIFESLLVDVALLCKGMSTAINGVSNR